MIYFSQAQIDTLLLEDIQDGDLTTRALGIGAQPGVMEFCHRQGGCVSGTAIARQVLASLGLITSDMVTGGEQVSIGQRLVCIHGNAAALHQDQKVVQDVLEWSCGVLGYLENMLSQLRQCYPDGQIACTHKAIPSMRLLATQVILTAGDIIHRGGYTETVLLFVGHRHSLTNPDGWSGAIVRLRSHTPEKKIVVGIDTPNEASAALRAVSGVLQLDELTSKQTTEIVRQAPSLAPHCMLALTGGTALVSLASCLDCGIRLFITSAPYCTPPMGIRVSLSPDTRGI